MKIKQNSLFYTPATQEELTERITELANASKNPAAVWTAVMMVQNFIAVEIEKEKANA